MAPRSTISEFRVRYAETDQMGVVYHTHYLVWCEVGRTDYLRSFGTSYAEIERTGTGLAVSELSIRYHAAARYDDPIQVTTTLSAVKSRTLVFDYVITHAVSGTKLATARTTLVSLDGDGQVAALPPDLRQRLSEAIC